MAILIVPDAIFGYKRDRNIHKLPTGLNYLWIIVAVEAFFILPGIISFGSTAKEW